MAERVTVNFFHQDRMGLNPEWAWFDASGYIPAPGDFVITPKGNRWVIVARTWQQNHRTGEGNVLDCNVVVVRDLTEEGGQ